jgi:hypothetical protein
MPDWAPRSIQTIPQLAPGRRPALPGKKASLEEARAQAVSSPLAAQEQRL